MALPPLLTIRFAGELLNEQAMPIYELGETFIALQRIVHKAYLHREGQLEAGERLRPDVRRKLALCVGSQRSGSDIYDIYRFLTDPEGLDLAKQLVPMALYGIGAYIGVSLAKGNQAKAPPEPYVQSIHNEVTIIADRIGNVGGVTRIEISSPLRKEQSPLTIDQETRDYVRALYGEIEYGRTLKISGMLTKLFTTRLQVELQIAPREFVRIFMNEELFRKVRYSRLGDHVTLRAQEMIRYSEKGRRQRRFQGVEIIKIEQAEEEE